MSKRINTNKAPKNYTGMVLLCTLVVWVLMLLDMLFIAKDSVAIVVMVSIGVWIVGIVIAKPGQFARRVQQVGFFKALLGEGDANGSASRGRRR